MGKIPTIHQMKMVIINKYNLRLYLIFILKWWTSMFLLNKWFNINFEFYKKSYAFVMEFEAIHYNFYFSYKLEFNVNDTHYLKFLNGIIFRYSIKQNQFTQCSGWRIVFNNEN